MLQFFVFLQPSCWSACLSSMCWFRFKSALCQVTVFTSPVENPCMISGSVLLIVPKLDLSPFANFLESDLVRLHFHVFTGIPCTFVNAIFFSNVGQMQALRWPWPHSFLTCWASSERQQLHLDFLWVTFVQKIFSYQFSFLLLYSAVSFLPSELSQKRFPLTSPV